MSTTYRVIEFILELGPVIIVPVILFFIGLFTTRHILRNLKNFAFILVGMISVAVLLTIFVNFFEPITNTIIINSLKEFKVIDTGWLVTETVLLNSPIIFQIIIAVAALNILMLFLRFTRTINIDLWNYWSFLVIGSIVFAITETMWIGILTALIVAAVTLVLADVYAHYIDDYMGLKGISNPQASVIGWAPVTHLVNFIFNKIPFIRRIHLFYEEIQYKLGLFSEPLIIGFIFGFIIGAITRYKTFFLETGPNLLYALNNGIRLSIILILLPRAVNLLLKGLAPAIYDIRSFIRRRITKRDINIGLDSIVLVGQPSVIALSVIFIPLTVYIATLLPGNTLLPGADLIIIPFILVWVVTPSRVDIFRSFISALIVIPLVLWITTDMGEIFTNFFLRNDLSLVEGYAEISSMGGSSNVFFWMLLQIIKPILNLFL